MNPSYDTLNDGCDGDSSGLAIALGDDYELIGEVCDEWGYGHHSNDAIFRVADGRFIHAEYGGCSCGGSGSWSYTDTLQDAERLIPEERRQKMKERREP